MPDPRPPRVVVMGAAGCGKSTIGPRLASVLAVPFIDGDDFHDEAARDQMAAGRPLSEAQRVPWFDRLHTELAGHQDDGAVLACSALTAAARDRLRGDLADLRFVALVVPAAVLTARLAARPDHFAGPDLVASQLATLELDARTAEVDANRPVAEVLAAVLASVAD